MDISQERIVLQEPYLRIGHDQGHDLIHLVWNGYAPSGAYRKGLDTALEYVLEHGITRWLADLRQMGAILQADEKWTNTHWFPQLANSELERMAILRSDDYFNAMSVERIMTNAIEVVGFEVAYFRTEEEAVQWLLA